MFITTHIWFINDTIYKMPIYMPKVKQQNEISVPMVRQQKLKVVKRA